MEPLHPVPPDPAHLARAPGDPLSEMLALLKLQGTFYCQSRLSAPWGIAVPAFPGLLTFFAVTRGQCWLRQDGTDIAVEQGEVVLLTGGRAYEVLSTPEARALDLSQLPVRKVTEMLETLEFGGDGAQTWLTFGILRLDRTAGAMLLEVLPQVIRVGAWAEARGETGAWLTATMQFIAREAGALRPGAETVITRLSDVVVIEAIRSWIATAPGEEAGWLRGLRDPMIGRAIAAIHQTPAHPWTVANLADIAGASRSAFAARFAGMTGLSPIHYVTRWRMILARERLLTGPAPIAQIAAEVGYQSEPAFHRAFKRAFDQTPGAVRDGKDAA